MARQYNDPINGNQSSIGPQLRDFMYAKKALIDLAKEQYFSPLADTTIMPKNYGKTIKKFHYIPMLHDANINDQGIDANGLSTGHKKTIIIDFTGTKTANHWTKKYAVADGADSATATTNAEAVAKDLIEQAYGTTYLSYADAVTAVTTAGGSVDDTIPTVPDTGNLYGSSKDIATISGKIPVLSEAGGRRNRVGFTRKTITGSIEKYGLFSDYTEDSFNFDTDAEKEMHINREMLRGAIEINEDLIQIDLINNAGIVMYGGDAVSNGTVTGESGGTVSTLTYRDLKRLQITLDNNRCPKDTTVIKGANLNDTMTIPSARILYTSSEMLPVFEDMVDANGNPVFIPYQKYANGTTILPGEQGAVGQFRIVVVPEMQKFAGAGATVTNNGGYMETNGSYDVYCSLVVGSNSFSTIGFQMSGKNTKFKLTHKKPGYEMISETNPYGSIGITNIQWYYGMLVERPEWIAVIKTVAPI